MKDSENPEKIPFLTVAEVIDELQEYGYIILKQEEYEKLLEDYGEQDNTLKPSDL